LFDRLNYGPLITNPLTDPKYGFNPWVQLIHGKNYISAPNTYAYSVDDAVGNIQAEGQGFIVDIGNTINLENQNLATQPIEITAPINKDQTYNFVSYSVCKRRPVAERKQLNPNFTTFVINAVNPPGCPVYIYDSKDQEYAFVVDGHVGPVDPTRTKAGDFAFFNDPGDKLRKPSKQTMQIIGCAGIPPSTEPPRA